MVEVSGPGGEGGGGGGEPPAHAPGTVEQIRPPAVSPFRRTTQVRIGSAILSLTMARVMRVVASVRRARVINAAVMGWMVVAGGDRPTPLKLVVDNIKSARLPLPQGAVHSTEVGFT